MNQGKTPNGNEDCRYHIVFAVKPDKKILFKHNKVLLLHIVRGLFQEFGATDVTVTLYINHMGIAANIPTSIEIPSLIRNIKIQSKIKFYARRKNQKKRYNNSPFWCRGYYSTTGDYDKRTVMQYVNAQREKDILLEEQKSWKAGKEKSCPNALLHRRMKELSS